MFQTYTPPSFYDQQLRVPDGRRQPPPFVNAFGVAPPQDNTLSYIALAFGGALLLSIAVTVWKATD